MYWNGKVWSHSQKISPLNEHWYSERFLHPAEAVHGDLGMVLPNSTLLAFSNSGETQEIIKISIFYR